MEIQKIGFGGGCHWCTEAYFQHLKGVEKVQQGWIRSVPPASAFSEAVIVHYDPLVMPLPVLIAIHLHTHASTKLHSLREKYRSAVYVLDGKIAATQALIDANQVDFREQLITQALPLADFKENTEDYQNYFRKNKKGAFCNAYIVPKLQRLQRDYAAYFQPL